MKDTIDIKDLKFSDSLLLRTPVLPHQNNADDLRYYLNLPLFRSAILVASVDLYRELEKAAFHYEALSIKSKASLWKYWNRMKFRPTPFGLFAAFSVARWGHTERSISVVDDFKFHIWHEFKKSLQLMEELLAAQNDPLCNYTINSTLYAVQQTYRYLDHEIQKDGNRSFRIGETDATDVLNDLISYCSLPMLFKDITLRLCECFAFSAEESYQYVTALIRDGILVHSIDTQVNITGTDYLLRNGKPLIKINCAEEFFPYADEQLYVNTERPLINDTLPAFYQGKIEDGLTCLMRFAAVAQNGQMQDFKKDFCAKYDRQQVPLLNALDPGIGIGYGILPGNENPSLLQNALFETPLNKGTSNWTPAHALLLQRWLSNTDQYAPLLLTPDDLLTLPTKMTTLPNSFSVLFRVADGTLMIEQAGGATGTALSGRFTPMNAGLFKEIKNLAQQEERANTQVIFAEISHIEDIHTANIDRREILYSYEIPILCGSVLAPEQQIALSDLYVSIVDDEIHLWSKKLDKRVIPRLSSAYNYLRSDLSVFRFLCGLQHEGIRSALLFDLQEFFPEQSFYPRVLYKETIIQLATWVIEADKINEVADLSLGQKTAFLMEIANATQWPRYVSLNEYDNQLVFDLENPEDLEQLAAQLKAGKRLLIREFLLENERNVLVQDQKNQGFINQFVGTLHHDREIYAAMPPRIKTPAVQRLFVPGSEWLYYKLYLHPAASNEILVKHILKCTRKLRTQGLIKRWFFVRYQDPAYHLRIRLQLAPKHAGHALFMFGKVLEELAACGIIQRYSIDSYERELERYTPEMIVYCEDLFCQSTALIMGWLEKITTNDVQYDYYYIALLSTRMMLNEFTFTDQDSIKLFRQLYEGMSSGPIKNRKGHNTLMKQKHREISNAFSGLDQLAELASRLLKKPIKLFSESARKIAGLTVAWPDEKRTQLLADLLHMHLNRLLVERSQKQEMILYYSFWRLIGSEAARKKASGLPVAPDQVTTDLF